MKYERKLTIYSIILSTLIWIISITIVRIWTDDWYSTAMGNLIRCLIIFLIIMAIISITISIIAGKKGENKNISIIMSFYGFSAINVSVAALFWTMVIAFH